MCQLPASRQIQPTTPRPRPCDESKHPKQHARHLKPQYARSLCERRPHRRTKILAALLHPRNINLRAFRLALWPQHLRRGFHVDQRVGRRSDLRTRSLRCINRFHRSPGCLACADAERSTKPHPIHVPQSNRVWPVRASSEPNLASNRPAVLSSLPGAFIHEKNCASDRWNRRRRWLCPHHPVPFSPLYRRSGRKATGCLGRPSHRRVTLIPVPFSVSGY